MDNMNVTGFKAAGIAAGIDPHGRKDLGIIFTQVPAAAAAVFTNNLVKAAPVMIDMEHIKSGKCQAVIVNSGNANCCTGVQGFKDAKTMARLTSNRLEMSEELVQVASTGVIGKCLPMKEIETSIPRLIDALDAHGIEDFAEAIMTTDTVPKVVCKKGRIGGKEFSMIGIAKGSGMIRPDMATMLCFVITDIIASPEYLNKVLWESVNKSFHRITVDGDTSTNDTVLIMANGMSGVELKDQEQRLNFKNTLDQVLIKLAKMIVKDGEGATKFVEIVVKGTKTDNDARQISNAVAHSNLVKTALFGEDANWGRIIAAVGRAGVPVEPDHMDIYFDDVLMVRNGVGCGKEAELKATEVLKKKEFQILIDLKMDHGFASMFTCDFSLDYVRINADYRS